ncbi:MAG: hypothetical protein ABIV63_12070, partial [Caldimonas sp.]
RVPQLIVPDRPLGRLDSGGFFGSPFRWLGAVIADDPAKARRMARDACPARRLEVLPLSPYA